MEPRQRIYDGSCAATSFGEKKYLAETSTRQLFQWRTKVGDPKATCIFRIGESPNDMKTLQPRDIQTEADGKFPCGLKSGFEAREFRMPATDCPDCMIELEFSYKKNTVFYCADIVLLEQAPMPPLRTI